MTTTWLDRSLVVGPYVCLVTTEEDYHKAMTHLKIKPHDRARWIATDQADATAHVATHPANKNIAVVVALRPDEKRSAVEVYGLLVHEAVHIFQEYCSRIGESRPSSEFEAYSIQSIAQRLMFAYAEKHLKEAVKNERPADQAGTGELREQAPVQ